MVIEELEQVGPNILCPEKAQKGMGLQLGLQFVGTLVTTFVLALFMAGLPGDWNPFGIAGFFWLARLSHDCGGRFT